jgi:glycine/D-amino acid oxidase-like deaminating enzyme
MIFNRGVFVLPLKEGLHKVGATYEHKDLSCEPTLKARNYLCGKLETLLKTGYEVVGQIAGVRPATKDRRPMMGSHPEYKPLGIFNGFGSKGVSLGPYFADQFAAFLEEETALEEAVDINRFIEDYCSATAQ